MNTTMQQPTKETNNSDRDSNGRFAAGNAGGPGNPCARYVGELRRLIMHRIDSKKVLVIVDKMYELAAEGNVQAAKFLFSYILGRPPRAVDPDMLDIEEWKQTKEEAKMLGDMPEVINKPGPELPLTMARAARPEVTEGVRQMYMQVAEIDNGRPATDNGKRETDDGQRTLEADDNWAAMTSGSDSPPSPNGKSAGGQERFAEGAARARKPQYRMKN